MKAKEKTMDDLELGDVFLYYSNANYTDFPPLQFIGLANEISQNGRGYSCIDVLCLSADGVLTGFESSNAFFTLEEVLFNMNDEDIVNDKSRGQVIEERLLEMRPEYFI